MILKKFERNLTLDPKSSLLKSNPMHPHFHFEKYFDYLKILGGIWKLEANFHFSGTKIKFTQEENYLGREKERKTKCCLASERERERTEREWAPTTKPFSLLLVVADILLNPSPLLFCLLLLSSSFVFLVRRPSFEAIALDWGADARFPPSWLSWYYFFSWIDGYTNLFFFLVKLIWFFGYSSLMM